MGVSAYLLNDDGWLRLSDHLKVGQKSSKITDTLIRHLRELGAVTVLAEDEYLDRDFTEAFAAYYSKLFKRHSKLCRRLHFFKCDLTETLTVDSPSEMAERLKSCQDDYLGYVVLRPIHQAPVSQVALKCPKAPAGCESHILVDATYKTHILGAEFSVSALPMTQQDQRIGACAQATIWSAGRHFYTRHRGPWISTASITEAAMRQESASASSMLPNGSEFLSMNGMVSALRANGRHPLMYVASGSIGHFDWNGLKPLDVISRYVDSGIPVILALNFGQAVGHAVIASGQILSTSIPQLPLSKWPSRAAFCEGVYVNDDQMGPNLRMPLRHSSSNPETYYNIEDNLYALLIPLPNKVFLPAEKAELLAWSMLSSYSSSWPSIRISNAAQLGTSIQLGDTFKHDFDQNTVLARTYLTYGWKYKQRLIRNIASDIVKKRARAIELPKYIWVTEFGTVDSFGKPDPDDRRIYSHCVVDATAKNMGEDSRLFFHAPGFTSIRTHNPADHVGPYREANSPVMDDTIYLPKRRDL
ncbi:hypothetical protein [Asticcacaulis benevestitus]|uniref:Uncharacterized protein n=1 Tax=Asticcacaulis benevestitus DSM 16100 = ATCC BAA-896 TaxID=1121022 RepID=V4P1G0_9CAUL|nr:hypothetical protein [Asticcacaulis benevestitus]ESQ79145.1 hypothetical protein ABENE_22825 [Asticcacaulis benevestitus DSM 16100 = ATCC BAA-896]